MRPPFGPLPHNLDAEEHILGAMLAEAALIPQVADRLAPAVFYLDKHRLVYETMLSLNGAASLVTVTDRLQTVGKLDDVGGAHHLAKLIERLETAANWEYHAEVVERCYLQRRTIEIGLEVAKRGAESGESVDEILGAMVQAESQIRRLAREHHQSGPAYTMDQVGDDYRFTWPRADVTIDVTGIHEERHEIASEVQVHCGDARLYWGGLTLTNTTRDRLAKKLQDAHPHARWSEMLETLCYDLVHQYRQGEPSIEMRVPTETDPPRGEERWVVRSLVRPGEIVLVVGDGGTGKSNFVTALAMAAALGRPFPHGFTAACPTPVLYLDYEDFPEVFEDRARAIRRGFGAIEVPNLYYRRMTAGLADDLPRIRSDISKFGIGLVIVDSLMPASGDDPETASATRKTLGAARQFLPAGVLVLAHITKAQAEQKGGRGYPWGSIFNWNLARGSWELRLVDDEDETDSDQILLEFRERKQNHRKRLAKPFGFELDFSGRMLQIRSHDVSDHPDVVARMSIAQQLVAELRHGMRTTADLAESLNQPANAVRTMLGRLMRRGRVAQISGDGTRGNPIKWGLSHL